MQTTWILIANGSSARLFETEKNSTKMKLLTEFQHPESRQKITKFIDGGRGRYRSKNDVPGGIYSEPTGPRQVELERFAHELAYKLNEGRTKNLYKNLILIAPAHFQGLMNKFVKSQVKNLVSLALYKDYTKLKQHELVRHLDGKLLLKHAA